MHPVRAARASRCTAPSTDRCRVAPVRRAIDSSRPHARVEQPRVGHRGPAENAVSAETAPWGIASGPPRHQPSCDGCGKRCVTLGIEIAEAGPRADAPRPPPGAPPASARRDDRDLLTEDGADPELESSPIRRPHAVPAGGPDQRCQHAIGGQVRVDGARVGCQRSSTRRARPTIDGKAHDRALAHVDPQQQLAGAVLPRDRDDRLLAAVQGDRCARKCTSSPTLSMPAMARRAQECERVVPRIGRREGTGAADLTFVEV